MNTGNTDRFPLAIGELSRHTGIKIPTLRMWERRYGAPQSQRLPSGHRRYSREEISRLRQVAHALELGYRPKHVVAATLQELESLIQSSWLTCSPEQKDEGDWQASESRMLMERWIETVQRYSGNSLNRYFNDEYTKRGPLNFLDQCAVPFVQRIGLEWKQGVLSVSQEHFATELLVNFLGSMWRKIQENNQGVTCVLSTLPEETHQLGLHMCALVAALAQMKIVYLGNNTPVEEIAGTVALSEASLLCISISSTYSTQDADRNLNKLRKGISKDVPIVVGGGGTPKKNLDGVLKFKNLLPFYDWLSSQSFKEIGK